jgi:hypothetical protein
MAADTMEVGCRQGRRDMDPVRFTAVLGPDRTIRLPEGVVVEPGPIEVTLKTPAAENGRTENIAQRLANAARELGITDLPADLAENHDHYAHGAPKGIDRP